MTIICKLLATTQAWEWYRHKLSRLSISTLQVRENSENAITVDLEFDNELDSSFWEEGQSPVNHNIGSQSAGLPDGSVLEVGEDASRPRSFLQVLFSQDLIQPRSDRAEPVAHLDQFSVPAIT